MKKFVIATALVFTALPFTFDGVTPTVSKAHAVIGRPLTPMSVAGVHRRAMRRTYGVGANLGYHPVARAALYGAAATGAGYYGAGYSSPAYGYSTAYNPPGPFTPAFGGTNGYGGYSYPAYGYGTGYGYHPVARAALYGAAAAGAGYYGAGYGGWGNSYGYGAPSYAGFGWGGGYSQEPIKSAVLDEAMQKSCMDRTFDRGPCEITGH
jgi:hypothetical protein